MMEHSAIYAGTFDPITLGHLDLIQRAAHSFDRVIVAVSRNSRRETMFSGEERLEMIREVVTDMETVEAVLFDGLLIDFAREKQINVLIRGLRAYSDFEYEFQMALTNRKLAPEVETLFLMPKEIYSYLSSSIVREIAELRGDLSDFVPSCVLEHISGYLAGRNGS
jgi:pantetheine-phosphate adenylyltransferase